MESRLNGRLVKWDDERGFGFVSHEDPDRDVFVHISEFRRRSPRPVQGDQLTFRIVQDDERGQRATHVRFANSKEQWSMPTAACALPGLLYFFAMGLYGLLYGINVWLPVAIFILSFLAYGMYWHDKRKAQRGEWRTQEQTLHIVSFLGGWPGALIAQWHIRHKNRKNTFQIVFWAVVLINVAAMTWFFMPKWTGPLVRLAFQDRQSSVDVRRNKTPASKSAQRPRTVGDRNGAAAFYSETPLGRDSAIKAFQKRVSGHLSKAAKEGQTPEIQAEALALERERNELLSKHFQRWQGGAQEAQSGLK